MRVGVNVGNGYACGNEPTFGAVVQLSHMATCHIDASELMERATVKNVCAAMGISYYTYICIVWV